MTFLILGPMHIGVHKVALLGLLYLLARGVARNMMTSAWPVQMIILAVERVVKVKNCRLQATKGKDGRNVQPSG